MQAYVKSFVNVSLDNFFSEVISFAFREAVQEACSYIGMTSPNPPVGCALLDSKGRILTVAAHHQAGSLHAEALALKQCRENGLWDQIAEAIVTLEPCNHVGRTLPCSQALLQSPVQRIWVGASDPNPHVCGGGMDYLRKAGLEVIQLDQVDSEDARHWALQCQNLIAPFVKFVTKQQSWITIKQALTASGSMYPPKGHKTFTSPFSLKIAHQLRRGTEAIITGISTIQKDWPSFTVRHVADHSHHKRILMICSRQSVGISDLLPEGYAEIAKQNGFELHICHDILNLSSLLFECGVMWGMVEAGPQLLQALKQENIWDEWLTIHQQTKGEDQITILSKQVQSPTGLLISNFKTNIEKGEICSLVS